MRVGRIAWNGQARYVRLDGDRAVVLSAAPWDGGSDTSDTIAIHEARLLAPVVPSKIVCVGKNYAKHAAEMGSEVPTTPLLFLKPETAIVGPGDAIELPSQSHRVEHEGELAVVIGKTTRHVAAEHALSHVFGYTCANDVTARDLQRSDVQFTRAKGFDTFCPLGPVITTSIDPARVGVSLRVNGEVRQDGNTRDMVFPVATLVAFVSSVMTLRPGDVILTGTPEGVGPLVDGDQVSVTVEGIGTLVNPVRHGR
jgi:2-keto-4-pentenoate hydratase/2-oxohepta-3-ene-1,7-dioic acid hydratase in catechol pathway